MKTMRLNCIFTFIKADFYNKAQINLSNFNNIFIEDLDKITKFTYKLYCKAFMNVYALDY